MRGSGEGAGSGEGVVRGSGEGERWEKGAISMI